MMEREAGIGSPHPAYLPTEVKILASHWAPYGGGEEEGPGAGWEQISPYSLLKGGGTAGAP